METSAFCSQGGGLYIDSGGEAHLTLCNIFENVAYMVSTYLLEASKTFVHGALG